jgi:hypothetical protein
VRLRRNAAGLPARKWGDSAQTGPYDAPVQIIVPAPAPLGRPRYAGTADLAGIPATRTSITEPFS